MPGYLFSYKKFKENYEMPIIRDEDGGTMKKLKMLIEPFVVAPVSLKYFMFCSFKLFSIISNIAV